MPYFITIYIHPMQGNIPHAFLGLTRKHPNELDTMKYEKEITYWDYNEGSGFYWSEETLGCVDVARKNYEPQVRKNYE